MTPSDVTDRSDHDRPFGWFEAVLVFILTTATRLPFLNHVPHKDELNHVLAARSILERGTLEIVAGANPYDRATGFTYLIAGVFRVFGESLVAARVPALLAGAGLAVALFLWVRAEAGRVAAWMAALLMVFSPVSMMLSQWVRFYTIHALLFFIACVLVYSALSDDPPPARRRWLLWGGAAACLAVAFHLQVVTLIGIGALGTWAGLTALFRAFRRAPSARHRRWLASAVGGAVVLAAGGAAVAGFGGWIVSMASYADLWAEGSSDNVRHYHNLFLRRYPTLWTLFPLAVVIAAGTRWRATLFCLCVFGVAFVAHSLVAWKTERYIFYALPMFFAIWGLAVSGAYPWLRTRVVRALTAVRGRPVPARTQGAVAAAALLGITLFAAIGNPAASYAVKMMTVDDGEWGDWGGYRGNPDWVAAGRALGSEVHEASAIVGSYDVTAIYALDRLDYLLRRVGTRDGDLPDFAIRRKSGVPVVSTASALSRVMACHPSGLVFIELGHHGADWSVTPEVVAYLADHAEAIQLPVEWRLIIYRWTGPVPSDDASCATLPGGP